MKNQNILVGHFAFFSFSPVLECLFLELMNYFATDNRSPLHNRQPSSSSGDKTFSGRHHRRDTTAKMVDKPKWICVLHLALLVNIVHSQTWTNVHSNSVVGYDETSQRVHVLRGNSVQSIDPYSLVGTDNISISNLTLSSPIPPFPQSFIEHSIIYWKDRNILKRFDMAGKQQMDDLFFLPVDKGSCLVYNCELVQKKGHATQVLFYTPMSSTRGGYISFFS